MNLLPEPQKISLTGGEWSLPAAGWIALNVPHPAEVLFTARRAQTALREYAGVQWTLAGGDLPAQLTLTLGALRPEGYRLMIGEQGVQISGGDSAGLFYGVATLVQLLQAHGARLPFGVIEDWPDFPARGVMLDISRDKVPTMETLYHLIDRLAGWKINQFQLYTEHTFAYRHHREVWANASPLTAEEILALDAYCRERYIDLVPNQNSFGHMHRWFEHPRYLSLAETETDVPTPWGTTHPPFSLSPAVPGVLPLIEELYAELLPNFSSSLFNVGCDETFDLGMGRTKALVEQRGKGRVYLDFVLEIYQRVQAHGRTMQFWGDIINQYPDLVPDIPRDCIALEWGYEADHDFAGKSKLFANSGVPFYVCPGTSSWTTIAGRTDNCVANIRNATENGLKNGAIGVLNTDWGDLGHWQPLPISYLGLAYGAALSWSPAHNVDLDLPAALDAFVFHDRAGIMGKLAYDLGNAYQKPGFLIPNGSLLFWSYQWSPDHLREQVTGPGSVTLRADLHTTLDYIDGLMSQISQSAMAIPDADLIQREFALTGRMLRHGAQRALFALGERPIPPSAMTTELDAIEEIYRSLWLARNRPGGLEDSVARLDRSRALFEEAEAPLA